MRLTLTTTRTLDELYATITTDGMCARLGYDDTRWMPDTAPPRSEHRRNELAEQAAAACDGCPVIAECRQWALATRQEHGIWGGLPEHEIAEHRTAARRQDRAERQHRRTAA